jgi:hypothetical protein
MAVVAMLDAPLVMGPLVEVRRKILVEFAGIGPKGLIFVAIAHNSPPTEKVMVRNGLLVGPEATSSN